MSKVVVARKFNAIKEEATEVEETAKAEPLSKKDAAELQHQMNEIGNHLTQSITHEGKGDHKKAHLHLIAAQTCSAGLCRMLNKHQKRLKKLSKA